MRWGLGAGGQRLAPVQLVTRLRRCVVSCTTATAGDLEKWRLDLFLMMLMMPTAKRRSALVYQSDSCVFDETSGWEASRIPKLDIDKESVGN